ncbi:MAG: nitroreductase/quinone reductase family protein [Candidatus Binatia bacterium]
MAREPFAANLHFIPRLLRRPQNALVRVLRRYFERAPGWVLLTTRGRKTGLQREVLLPCERSPEGLLLISTYGWRSNWIRNIQRDASVTISAGGWLLSGHAELVETLDAKTRLVSAYPFFPAAPFAPLHAVLRTVMRPLLVLFLRRWVRARPLVVVHPIALIEPAPHAAKGSSPRDAAAHRPVG